MVDEPRVYEYGSYFLGPIEVESAPAAAAAVAPRPAPVADEIPPAEPVAAPSRRLHVDTSYRYFGAPESPRSAILSAGPSSPINRRNQSSSPSR